MAFTLTKNTQLLSKGIALEPSLVLEIDGLSTIFGLGSIKKYIRIGDEGLFIGNDWVIGGYNLIEDQLDVVTFDGTSTSISQQMLQDKGGTSSVSNIKVALIDKDELVTNVITPNGTFDILGRKAKVYLGYRETAFPFDYIQIFSGIVDDIEAGSIITINVAHPEQKKRQELFLSVKAEVQQDLNSIIVLKSFTGKVIDPCAEITRYVRIDDEIIHYTNLVGNTLTGLSRAQFDTIQETHSADASCEFIYRLQGNAIDLALKLMLSGDTDYHISDVAVSTITNGNELYFDQYDIADKYGLVVGDLVTMQGYFTLKPIKNLIRTEQGSIIVVDDVTLATEFTTSAKIAIKSKYNVLTTGLDMSTDEVDVKEFERIKGFFSSFIPSYDFLIKETINAKDFIDTQILFPFGAYSLGRKGRASMGITAPPLALERTVKLTTDNVTNINKIKARRSLGKFFYNNIVYKFNPDAIEDKMLNGYITVSADSQNRIKVGNKSMLIESKGLRPSSDTERLMRISSVRLLDRYQYAAETFEVNAFYGDAFNTEVGDIVRFSSPNLPDTKTGTRAFQERLMEVINKKMDIKTGALTLTLTDTNYLVNGRYGIISPSSKVVSATINTLTIADSYAQDIQYIEQDKWLDYIGNTIIIHSFDWSQSVTTKLLAFDESNPYKMIVSEMLTIPSANWIVDIADYDNAEDNYKIAHCFFAPMRKVVAQVAANQVSVDDVTPFFVNCYVQVYGKTNELQVTAIDANIITLSENVSLVANDEIQFIGFKSDEGGAYRYI